MLFAVPWSLILTSPVGIESLIAGATGWNKVREKIFANQKRLGIMPENAKLTPWPKDLPEWDSLSWDEKKLFIKQADVYGAYLAYADR